ncbi:MAG: FAD-dependent oxidoreductase [Bryobacteraceae bacterium]|nr:FAD-dependent oxidoreductase [Bryobacteraceae bacterium]MDW8378275.1 FAD-dependent oxidoreductase [Bryobacterales bacterium]
MKRRDFLTAGFGTYSLIVKADQIPPAPYTPSQVELQGLFQRPEFEKIAPSKPLRQTLAEEPNMRLVDLETDVLVAGGGLAGVLAAVSAARHGAKVVLVQDRSRLGGNSSSEVKMHVVGSNSHKARPGWREGGLLEEFRLDDAVNNPHRCWELWDLLLYDKVISEPNITLLLETVLYRAQVKQGKIQMALARCDKSEHIYRIKAKIFCDCTGDSRLGLEAGAEMRTGREARSEFGESLAPEKADGETLGSSILFTSRLYPRAIPFRPPKWARKVRREHLVKRKINSWEYGYWWIEWGGNRDTIGDNERIRFELLSITLGVWDYIKNSGDHPESSHYGLDWVGMMPGKRGSRRLVGDYILRQQDLENSTPFPDAVAIGGWPMDDHPPGGFDRSDLPPAVQIRTKEVYTIPLRCLYSRNIANLMMAGRNISASHVAFTSTRVMGTCAVEGQAIGTAAALCVKHGWLPREIANDSARIRMLQQQLLRDDQTITTVINEDPLDLARQAKVVASHQQDDAPAILLLDGHVRDIPKGARHQWAAKLIPNQTWVDFIWQKPQTIRHVQLTFDTGFQRELTLTASNTINQNIIRAPQPETVRDYRLWWREAEGAEWKLLVERKGNYQRLARHDFPPTSMQALRVQIDATNGDELARLFEVRCYA